MRGTIIKRGSRYSVVLDLGRDSDGKRIRRWHSGYRTRKDAEEARIDGLSRLQRGVYIEPSSSITVSEFAQDWLKTKVSVVAPNTLQTYRRDLESHVLPFIGTRPLQQLQPGEVNALYAELLTSGGRSSQGLSPKSVRNVHGVIHKILADATRWGLVPRNAASVADAPRAKKPETRTWTATECRAFLESVSEDRLAALWRLLATTGLRRSEALGLRWRNVDLTRNTMAVQDTLVMVDNKPVLRIGATKSESSARVIALDDATAATMREHRKRQLKERLIAGSIWTDLDLVFCRETGSVLSPDWVTRRARSLTEACGLPWVGLHSGLRHGWATWALEAGIPAKVVSERLGHSSISTTLDRYSHVIEGMDRQAAEAVADVLAW